MIALTSLACLFPWGLLRREGAGRAGLLAGIFLAANPILADWNMPYVSSDPLGFFCFALALFWCVRALRDETLGAHLLAGLGLALMMLSRTVFIPLAPFLAVVMLVLSRDRRRALAGATVFVAIALGYDYLASTQLGGSYFLYFLKDGMKATVHHRTADVPQQWWELAFWMPRYAGAYAKMILSQLMPGFAVFSWGVAALAAAAAAAALLLRPRLFLFLFIAAAAYFWEIASYHQHERLAFPIVFAAGMLIAIGLAGHPLFKRGKTAAAVFAMLFLAGTAHAVARGVSAAAALNAEKKFLEWVKKTAPEKAILTTDRFIDPWKLLRETGRPVFYDVTLSQTLAVVRNPTPTRRVLFLADQSQIPPLYYAEPTLDPFEPHRYVLDGLAKMGYRYLVVQEGFARKLETFYFQNDTRMSVNPRDYRLKKLADYPADPSKGIWILERTEKAVKFSPIFTPPPHPADLDRFLSAQN